MLAGFDFDARDASRNLASVRYGWGDGVEAKTIDIFNNSWAQPAAFYMDFPQQGAAVLGGIDALHPRRTGRHLRQIGGR